MLHVVIHKSDGTLKEVELVEDVRTTRGRLTLMGLSGPMETFYEGSWSQVAIFNMDNQRTRPSEVVEEAPLAPNTQQQPPLPFEPEAPDAG